MVKNMNKQKKPYNKPGSVFENFLTGELTGTPEMIEKIQSSRMDELEEVACPAEDVDFACSIRGGS